MKVDMLTVGAPCLMMVLVCIVAAIPGKDDEDERQEVRKQELYLLAKLLHPNSHRPKDGLEVNKAKAGALGDLEKRQGAWDMDYGWGGGRFGKRADMLDYGWGGGRFGKRAEMLDYGWGGGRFGKRSGDMLDYGWGGGRFGKRSADNKKRFDLYGSGGRFGRDVDHVDPADEQ